VTISAPAGARRSTPACAPWRPSPSGSGDERITTFFLTATDQEPILMEVVFVMEETKLIAETQNVKGKIHEK
jgi:hypothetical protein